MTISTVLLIMMALVAYGLISRKLKGSILTGPLLFTIFGLIIGPAVLGLTSMQVSHGTLHTLEKAGSTSNAFSLDESILAIHESETKDVQSMLGDIFVEDELEADSEQTETISISSENENGIDGQHYSLFECLMKKDIWPLHELEAICRERGLLVNGALEIINEWSFEKVDAPVLEEDGDTIYIDQEIVEELEG